jgi:hypothetical protein
VSVIRPSDFQGMKGSNIAAVGTLALADRADEIGLAPSAEATRVRGEVGGDRQLGR